MTPTRALAAARVDHGPPLSAAVLGEPAPLWIAVERFEDACGDVEEAERRPRRSARMAPRLPQ